MLTRQELILQFMISLAANSNMLRLMGSLGFTSKTAAEDPAIREVTAIL